LRAAETARYFVPVRWQTRRG